MRTNSSSNARRSALTLLMALALSVPFTAWAGTFIGVVGDRDGQSLPNAVVALKPIGGSVPAAPPTQITVTQEAMTFKPYISVIRPGSSVVFANRDTVEHHIKSFSSSKPFEIAVHKPGDTPPPIRFDKDGAIVAYCILHDWMRAYVYVVDSPWTGVAPDTGIVRIENVPAGEYEVLAWHPDLGQVKPPLTSRITITATGNAQSTIKFDFKPRPIRKAPKTGETKTVDAHMH